MADERIRRCPYCHTKVRGSDRQCPNCKAALPRDDKDKKEK